MWLTTKGLLMGPLPADTCPSVCTASIPNHPSHPARIQVLQPDLQILALGASSVGCLKHPLFPVLSVTSLSQNS